MTIQFMITWGPEIEGDPKDAINAFEKSKASVAFDSVRSETRSHGCPPPHFWMSRSYLVMFLPLDPQSLLGGTP
jgi:hypothetical protein